MTLIEFDLTVITVCFVVITVGLVLLMFSLYRVFRRLEERIDSLASQVEPAFVELRKTVNSLSDSLKTVNSLLSFTSRFKRSKKD